MNTLSPHITLSAVARRFSLVWLMLLLGTLSIFAQSASDFSVTVVSTPSTCVQNGQVEIKVSKVPGAPTNYTYKAYYDLLNSKGVSVTTTQTYVIDNVISNLYPDTYTARVRVVIQESGLQIDLPTKTAVVTSTYKNPTVNVRVVRKSLNNYRANGSSTPLPTGILSVTVRDGNGPYQLRILEAPASYTAKKEYPMMRNGVLFLYEVPVGTYRLQVSDACGETPIQTIEMTNVRTDLPNPSSHYNMPFRVNFSMTSDMRLNHCGWIQLPIKPTHNTASEPDLKPYLDNKDTLARYYDYAWQTQADWNAKKPREYHEFFKTAPFGADNYGSDKDGIYYKLPEGVTYQTLQTNAYRLLAFLRVKGSSEEFTQGYVPTNYASREIDVDYETVISDPCSPTYVLRVKPHKSQDKLLCFPITVRVVSKTNPKDKQELVLTEDMMSVDFPQPLKVSESYTMTTISGRGLTNSEIIPSKTIRYSLSSNVSSDYCMGSKTTRLALWRSSPSTIPMAGHKIRFVSAPAGFTPVEGALAVGEEYTIPENITDKTIYPLSPKANISERNHYYILPAGEYRFEITEPCNNTYELKLTIPEGRLPRYAADLSRFAPRTVKEECGRVRIYPFAGGSEGILTKDGVSVQPYFKITKLPRGGSFSDIRSNISNKNYAWRVFHVFTSSYSDIPDPKSIYIDFPVTEGDVVLKMHLYEDGEYETADCLPLISLPLTNPPLTYDRDTYIGYICPSKTSGLLHLVPVNCVGDATIEIYDTETNVLKWKFTEVDKTDGIRIELKGSPDNPIPSSYRIKITDGLCQNTSDEIIALYSLASPSVIRSKGQQRKFCVGDRIELEVINLGEKAYEWTLPNGERRSGRKLVIDQAELKHSGQYSLSVSGILCDGVETMITLTTDLSVAPRELWWRQDATDQNWNNPNNWSQADGQPIQAVPASCTVVHIPAQVDKGYPDLSAQSTLRDPFGDPVCSDIYFHYGAQLGSPQLLTYERAFVDYNFGKMSNGGSVVAYKQPGHPTADSKLLARDRWYMVATPLNNMLSGDFSLAGYPKTYQRYLVASQQSNSVTDVTFARPFDTMVQTFAPPIYYHALALKVAGWESGRKGYDDHKNLNKIDGIIRIPFFADASRADAYPLHSYDESAGVSTFRYYNEETLAPLAYTERANRGAGVYPYRFVYERYNASQPTASEIATIPDGGVTLQGYAMSISRVTAESYFMVGNPFMTPIDFDKLWEFNKEVIYPYYYVFENNQWRFYSVETPDVSTRGKEIAPLQAILLRKKYSNSSELRFPTSGDKSVLLASWSLGRGDLVSTQSVAMPNKTTTLPIHLQKGLGGDAPQASAYVVWDGQGDNIPALVNNEYSESPLVYVVDSDSGAGEIVLYPKRETGRLDVGVRASYASEMVLDFSDMDKSLYEYMTLTDRKSGREQDLLRQPQYRFVHELGVADPRFTLQLKRYGVPTAVEEPAHDFVTPEISIHAVEERCIVQANQPIALIEVYDLSGQQLYRYVSESGVPTLEHAISLRELPRSMVVKVYLESGFMDIRKVQF